MDYREIPHVNPEDRPGVRVYRPKALAAVEYEPDIRKVIDTSNGDYLITRLGHGTGIGHYTFGNAKKGMIAHGGFYYRGGNTRGLTIYEIPGLRTRLGGDAPYLARSEFEISRIAEMFRARMDAANPRHRTEVVVIDSRPEKPSAPTR